MKASRQIAHRFSSGTVGIFSPSSTHKKRTPLPLSIGGVGLGQEPRLFYSTGNVSDKTPGYRSKL
jgi:hypothetical protein